MGFIYCTWPVFIFTFLTFYSFFNCIYLLLFIVYERFSLFIFFSLFNALFWYRMQQVPHIEISKIFTGNHQNVQREVEFFEQGSFFCVALIFSVSFSLFIWGVVFWYYPLLSALCSLLFSLLFSALFHFSTFRETRVIALRMGNMGALSDGWWWLQGVQNRHTKITLKCVRG